MSDARRGRDRDETGPKNGLRPRAHACGAGLRDRWKSSAVLGKVSYGSHECPSRRIFARSHPAKVAEVFRA